MFAVWWLFEYNALAVYQNTVREIARVVRATLFLSAVFNTISGIVDSMSKGYAFGFLIVILIVILGLYVAFTGFMSSREALRTQSASAPSTGVVQVTTTPTRPAPTPTATMLVIPSPVPGITATLTAVVPTTVVESLPPTEPPPPPTEPPPARPTDTPTPFAAPPTPVPPAPAYQFRLAGPPTADPNYQICCYIYGTVRDAAGNGLEGIQVQASNEWNTLPPAVTKGGAEAGQYNIPIGREVVTWYVIVLDATGNQISSQVQIQYDPGVANGYRVEWQRGY